MATLQKRKAKAASVSTFRAQATDAARPSTKDTSKLSMKAGESKDDGDAAMDADEAARRLRAVMDAQFGYLFENNDTSNNDNSDSSGQGSDDSMQDDSESDAEEGPSHDVEDMRSDDDEFDEDNQEDFEKNAAPQVDVVVFDESAVHSRRQPPPSAENGGRLRDWKAFMSSEIEKVAGRRRPLSPLLGPTKKNKPTTEEVEQDKQDDEHDRELMDLLKTTKLIEQYTESELTGRDRINRMKAKIVELGGKPGRAPSAPVAVRMGMRAKAAERARKKLQEAKDTGVYHKSLRTQIMGSDGAVGGIDAKRKQRAAGAHRKRTPGGNGIFGSVGHITDGVMRVSKKHIDAVNKSDKRPVGKFKKRRSNLPKLNI